MGEPHPEEAQDGRAVLDVRKLHYSYGNRAALNGVTFSVARASIHGFVGPNGAGKTTTLKILATLLRPRDGTARVLGHDLVHSYKAVRRQIGFMPDTLSMYRQMTVFEYLDFFGAAYGMALGERECIIKDVLALTDMGGRRNDFIHSLSRGMQQRVSLARTLVHDPKLLLLDEPAAGLDPRARIELMEILRELSRMGKTIFISSHILAELATLCDSVTIIDRGVTRFSGTMADLLSMEGETTSYRLTLALEHPRVAEVLAKAEGIVSVTKAENEPVYQIVCQRDKVSPNDILAMALQAEARVVAFEKGTRHLDEAFMALTEPGVPT